MKHPGYRFFFAAFLLSQLTGCEVRINGAGEIHDCSDKGALLNQAFDSCMQHMGWMANPAQCSMEAKKMHCHATSSQRAEWSAAE